MVTADLTGNGGNYSHAMALCVASVPEPAVRTLIVAMGGSALFLKRRFTR